jgi:regulatory protein YycI of two-component signal transduction system YycFG
MEWKKAKNYTIVFLIIINCVFLILNVIKHNENRLSTEDITAVKKVLTDRGVELDCELPVDFSAMDQLNMRAYEYDNIVLQEIFLGDIGEIRRTETNSDLTFSNDIGKLTVSNDSVRFESDVEDKPSDITEAREIIDEYVNQINSRFGDYSFNVGVDTDDGYFFEYRQNFRGQVIFSNYFKAWIADDGRVEIVFNYQEPVECKKSDEDIISADEAVYAAARNISEYEGESFVISDVEKGYYLTERHGSGDVAATPQYKIYVNEGRSAYYVNAYSGDVMED